jgi:RimJ/RimL family protein N-acetyltransferase
MIIKPITQDLLPSFYSQFLTEFSENGKHGPHTAPFARGEVPTTLEKLEARFGEALFRDITLGNWERAFVAVNEDHSVVGNCVLGSHFIHSSAHRCKLGMGILHPYQGQGIGRKLLHAAIDWAKTQSTLEWIDLYTFESNLRAIKLYKSVGFKEVGRVPDRFRLDGESISDVQMVLKIR